jgi:hypothetical protein
VPPSPARGEGTSLGEISPDPCQLQRIVLQIVDGKLIVSATARGQPRSA